MKMNPSTAGVLIDPFLISFHSSQSFNQQQERSKTKKKKKLMSSVKKECSFYIHTMVEYYVSFKV